MTIEIKPTAHITLNDLGPDAYLDMIEDCGPSCVVDICPDDFEVTKPFWTAMTRLGYPPAWFVARGVESIVVTADY